jgi:hypothetical protein
MLSHALRDGGVTKLILTVKSSAQEHNFHCPIPDKFGILMEQGKWTNPCESPTFVELTY